MRTYLRFATGLGEFLESEYQHRKAKNPSYSYRAFGRDLKLSPSHLNGILHKKAGLSHERISSLSSFLRLSEEEQDYLWALTEQEFAKAKAVKKTAVQRLDALRGKQKERVLSSEELESVVIDCIG